MYRFALRVGRTRQADHEKSVLLVQDAEEPAPVREVTARKS